MTTTTSMGNLIVGHSNDSLWDRLRVFLPCHVSVGPASPGDGMCHLYLPPASMSACCTPQLIHAYTSSLSRKYIIYCFVGS